MDALIFQTGTSNPGSVVSSMDLITDAGLIGQFPGKPVIKLQGWRVLAEDELRQELPVRLLTTAPDRATGYGMGRARLRIQHKGADPAGKGMEDFGDVPTTPATPQLYLPSWADPEIPAPLPVLNTTQGDSGDSPHLQPDSEPARPSGWGWLGTVGEQKQK